MLTRYFRIRPAADLLYVRKGKSQGHGFPVKGTTKVPPTYRLYISTDFKLTRILYSVRI